MSLFLSGKCPANRFELSIFGSPHFTFMSESNSQTPKFFDLLSHEDQKEYKLMRSGLSHVDYGHNGTLRVLKFQEILSRIREFCEKPDGSSWTRYLVCGVCHFDRCLVLNIRQLGILIDKCKSSISGSLNRMGLARAPLKGPVLKAFLEKIPQIESDFAELREWSVRVFVAWAPRPVFSPPPKLAVIAPTPNQTALTPPPSIGEVEELTATKDAAEKIWSEPDDDLCLTPSFLHDGTCLEPEF
jgi:hypothetical protein